MTNKTAYIFIAVICALICVLLTLAWYAIYSLAAARSAACECYALTTCVVEVDRDNDIVTCEDSNGNLWEFYGCEDWQEGDCASLLMNNQGTPSIYDDAIEGARYSAWALAK